MGKARPLADAIEEAAGVIAAATGPLEIQGAGTYAGCVDPVTAGATPLATTAFTGITAYEPAELFVRAGAGTTVKQLRDRLARKGQRLAGDFAGSPKATIGGALAGGLDGPDCPGHGRLRDHLLGCRLITGAGEVIGFGGDVIKNVAGYDVGRLQVGALGTLGVLAEVSLRVAGLPETDLTIARECLAHEAILAANQAAARGWPVIASVWHAGTLHLRLAGNADAVKRAHVALGGDKVTDAPTELWEPLRELRWGPLGEDGQAWLCRMPPLAELPWDGAALIEWHGARRWYFREAPPDMRTQVASAGGCATLWRRGPGLEGVPAIAPPPQDTQELHRSIKEVFDPHGILNPGRFGYL